MKNEGIFSVLLISICIMLCISDAFGELPVYTITDLGTLGGSSSMARGINELGQVVGDSWTLDDGRHGFLWDSSTGMMDLGRGYAQAINNAGQVVGQYNDNAFFWDSVAGMTEIVEGYAYDISELGQVVGGQGPENYDDDYDAFLWDETNGLISIEILGVEDSTAWAINEAGQVAGWMTRQRRAFIWDSVNGMVQLPDFGPVSMAYDINNDGQLVGSSYVGQQPDTTRAFLWDSDGSVAELETLYGRSAAYAINDAGDIVGSSRYSSGIDYHACMWIDGEIIDLNPLLPQGSGWELVFAYDINNLGQIVGTGLINGEGHAFLLVVCQDC